AQCAGGVAADRRSRRSASAEGDAAAGSPPLPNARHAMTVHHVVVDGSNIATEGRDTPSLAQLDEAVRAFVEEFKPKYVTVVVDATFPNRIDRKERKTYEEAIDDVDPITPPAVAVDRGDTHLLRTAPSS